MSVDAQRVLREVQEHFRLPNVGLVEKDLYVVKAIAALAAIDVAPFTLVFGGGTALARAHKIIRRMSEDVDSKIVPFPAAPVSRSGIRRALGRLGAQVTAAWHAAGFVFDPKEGSPHLPLRCDRAQEPREAFDGHSRVARWPGKGVLTASQACATG